MCTCFRIVPPKAASLSPISTSPWMVLVWRHTPTQCLLPIMMSSLGKQETFLCMLKMGRCVSIHTHTNSLCLNVFSTRIVTCIAIMYSLYTLYLSILTMSTCCCRKSWIGIWPFELLRSSYCKRCFQVGQLNWYYLKYSRSVVASLILYQTL